MCRNRLLLRAKKAVSARKKMCPNSLLLRAKKAVSARKKCAQTAANRKFNYMKKWFFNLLTCFENFVI